MNASPYVYPGIVDIKNHLNDSIRDLILRTVGKYFGLPYEVMVTRIRNRDIVFPRQVAMYLMRKKTTLSCKSIALHLGYHEHSAVSYAVGQVSDLMDSDPQIKNSIKYLSEKLNSWK